uniref:WGS project CAEQ00000000 data, annotated contig 1707 n=1 Tax=Trypanosoma congolense (strain IL3000) TaxID=1068625 RepID=F9W853_TRYCI|nr:unnamed protein product [Trypanosoma congolense IL3000]
MQVTKDNLTAVLPKFMHLLQTCDFYAFDEEMTGINVSEIQETITDTPEESYRAKRAAASRYNIIQVGICLFQRKREGTETSTPVSYVAHPFNFVLFPNHMDDLTDVERPQDVVLSPSSLAFLRRHDMNFQSWVYRGMTYCNAAQEAALRQKHEEKHGSKPKGLPCQQQRHHAQTMELLLEEEREWLNASLAAAKVLRERAQAALERARAQQTRHPRTVELDALMDLKQSGGREVILQPQRSKNARECLEWHMDEHYEDIFLTFRRAGGVYHGTMRALFPTERAQLLEKERASRDRELVDKLGFRLVFKALVESKKPCVGHNCLADILFLLASFDGEPPGTLPAFKHRVGHLFPMVFDTKYIATRQDLFPPARFTAHYLGGYFDEYGFNSACIHVSLPLGFEAYDPLTIAGGGGGGNSPTHEAGYDALLTGVLLLNLLAEVGVLDVAEAPLALVNRLALFRSLFAIHLGEDEGDEYLPQAGVLELRHENHVRTHHIDNCFAALSIQGVTLHGIDELRTLAVLPPTWMRVCNVEGPDVEWLSTQLTSRFPQYFQATPYVAPLNSGGGKGAFRVTPVNLSRFFLRAFPR